MHQEMGSPTVCLSGWSGGRQLPGKKKGCLISNNPRKNESTKFIGSKKYFLDQYLGSQKRFRVLDFRCKHLLINCFWAAAQFHVHAILSAMCFCRRAHTMMLLSVESKTTVTCCWFAFYPRSHKGLVVSSRVTVAGIREGEWLCSQKAYACDFVLAGWDQRNKRRALRWILP